MSPINCKLIGDTMLIRLRNLLANKFKGLCYVEDFALKDTAIF